ncbi:hypothetical protein MHM_00290 [Candidatus Mycoplasma haemominutum 'Birmingham 1']|uniref:Uncharacterized protein n=1 Tax=Candidatus Mycoplasma haematominutum 'Birmingham 1' TaxID=1116213 RepID=G8C2J9_9MOLU|nr:hypothetical protein MHM_00290 [Candidatus Mycoplasma haematominutum 'Birmingham 1']
MLIVLTVTPLISLFCIYELWRGEMKMGYGEFNSWLLREGLTREYLMSRWRDYRAKQKKSRMSKVKPQLHI